MIPLGYELGSGTRVKIPVNHTVVLGQTQLSGKTTTLEAMVTRSDVKAIGFITKPGESSFRLQTQIPAFFSESTQEEFWKHVVAMLEYRSEVRLGWRERGVVIKLCQDYKKESSRIGMPDAKGKSKRERVKYSWKAPKSLAEFLCNVNDYQEYAGKAEEMICIQLREFLKPVIREIEHTPFSDKLQLARGINVMDITELSDGLKSLVIRSVIEWVHKHGRKIVVIIPEAWKFIPEGRSTPVKLALEGLIREGAGVGNFVWMDSQDLRGVDKLLLRSVIVWLFGVQRQKNEVASTLASIPDHPKPTATEIMQLGKGEFYVCYGTTLVRTYVQPAGMDDVHAQAIACGEERPESWAQIARSLDEESDEKKSPREMRSDESPNRPSDDGRGAAESDEPAAAGARAAEGDAERLEKDSDSEDPMWKETHEAFMSALAQSLGCDNEPDAVIETIGNLKRAHDALAERIRLSEASGETVLHAPSRGSLTEPGAGTLGQSREKAAGALSLRNAPAVTPNGDYDSIYHYIVARVAKEQPPAIFSVLAERPELQVKREIKTIQAHGSTLKGGLGILISEKFFDAARPYDDVRREFVRRGFIDVKTPNRQIEGAIDALVSMGFLTREETGLKSVSGMKVNIVEARA